MEREMRSFMNRPLDWMDRLNLASDPMTNDLGQLGPGEAQAALDRIAELEGALKEIVAEGDTVHDTPHAIWRVVERTNETARAVLAKGDG